MNILFLLKSSRELNFARRTSRILKESGKHNIDILVYPTYQVRGRREDFIFVSRQLYLSHDHNLDQLLLELQFILIHHKNWKKRLFFVEISILPELLENPSWKILPRNEEEINGNERM